MNMKLYGIAAAVMLALAGAAQAQTSPAPSTPRADPADRAGAERVAPRTDPKVKNAEEDRIEAEYKAEKARCDTMSGNAKDVCIKEAKGKEKIAKAELDARAKPSQGSQRKVEEAKAEAKYEVAMERCDDMQGKDLKEACQKEAKAEQARAKAAMAKQRSTASAGSSR